MKKYLLPDYDFATFDEITPDFLLSHGIKALICDIDNTLVPYDIQSPTDKVVLWLNSLGESGIKVIFVSNNEKERVEKFNEGLGLPYIYKSGKPLKKAVSNALNCLKAKKEEAAVLGDQLLTDVATAKFSGLPAIWVPSIKKVNTPFFRFKGIIEKPFIKLYFKKKAKKT